MLGDRPSYRVSLAIEWKWTRWIAVLLPLSLPVATWVYPPPPEYSTLRLIAVLMAMLAAVWAEIGLMTAITALLVFVVDRALVRLVGITSERGDV